MQIYRVNHTRTFSNNQALRMQMGHDLTKDFNILKAGTESGIEVEAKYLGDTWTVGLSPDETDKLIRSLLKKS